MQALKRTWLEHAREVHPQGESLLRKYADEPAFLRLVTDKAVTDYGLEAEVAVAYAISRANGRASDLAVFDACCEWDV